MKLSTRFLLFDDRLAGKDVPPLSPWWRAEATRYLDDFEAGRSTEWWAAVGRGGNKSTVLYKLALFFALFGDFDVPPDERHWAIVISRLRTEAEKGVLLISKWLDKLGVTHRAVGSEIELGQSNRGIRVVTASVGAASGWRAFFLGCDEFAKWQHDGAAIQLDADETRASAIAMGATHPMVPVLTFSSPWLADGSFFATISAGDMPGVIVSGPVPGWISNPEAVTEASTRRKERNEIRWRREYACTFSNVFEGGFFPVDAIEACTDRGRSPTPTRHTPGANHIITIDPAFTHDLFGIVIAHAEQGRVLVDYVEALAAPRGGGSLSADFAISRVVALRRAWPGPNQVHSDQFSAVALRDAFWRKGVVLTTEPWTLQTKFTRYTLARSLLVDRRMRLPDDPALRKELGGIGLKLTTAGNETISSRGGTDDRASALVHVAYLCARMSPGFGVYDGDTPVEMNRAPENPGPPPGSRAGEVFFRHGVGWLERLPNGGLTGAVEPRLVADALEQSRRDAEAWVREEAERREAYAWEGGQSPRQLAQTEPDPFGPTAIKPKGWTEWPKF